MQLPQPALSWLRGGGSAPGLARTLTVGFTLYRTQCTACVEAAQCSTVREHVHVHVHGAHRYMAELAVHLMLRAMADVKMRPLRVAEVDAAAAPLPTPMIPHNFESKNDKCFIGTHFTEAVTAKVGRGGRQRLRLKKLAMHDWLVEGQGATANECMACTRPGVQWPCVRPGVCCVKAGGRKTCACRRFRGS